MRHQVNAALSIMNEQRFIDEIKKHFLMSEKDLRHVHKSSEGEINPHIIKLNSCAVGCLSLEWNRGFISAWVHITYLYIYESNCGIGSEILKTICEIADSLKISLFLDVVPQLPDDNSIPEWKLKVWYKSFGFVASEIQGSSMMERQINA